MPRLSQEALKLIACAAMLADHVGAALLPGASWLRILGRIAFPIYCFLLVEGAFRTGNPGKYALRLGVGAILSEIPFDLALFGRFTWQYQSVMLTLLLGFGLLMTMKRTEKLWVRGLLVLPFALAAEVLGTDYGGYGVVLIAWLALAKGSAALQIAGAAALFWLMDSYPITVFGLAVPIELFALAAFLPIFLYNGEKWTHARSVQWAFYLFYPVHLSVLLLLRCL